MNPTSATTKYLDCNSQAVDLLQQGNPWEAAHILRAALVHLESELSVCHPLVATTGGAACHPSSSSSTSSVSSSSVLLSGKEDFSTYIYGSFYGVSVCCAAGSDNSAACRSILQSSQNVFSFYPRAFQVDDDAKAYLTLSTSFVILIYNLALSLFLVHAAGGGVQQHHQPQKEGNNTTTRELRNVIRLYQAALNAGSVMWDDQYKEEMIFLVAAITNNLGYLHCLLDDVAETRDYLQYLLNLMTHPAAEDVIPLEDYDFFQANTCMYQPASGSGGMIPLISAPAA